MASRVVRCKMILTERNERKSGASEKVVGLKFSVVGSYTKAGLTQEDQDFFKWTPYGELSFGTINYEAAEGLELGTEYYVDIVKAGEGE